jgi:hypothetical protein
MKSTPALDKGTASVWQCSWCGSLVYTTRGTTKPPGPCAVCPLEDFHPDAAGWWRQSVPVGPFTAEGRPDTLDSMTKIDPADLVSIQEIATALEVRRDTVDKWRYRGVLPEPIATVASGPLWLWPDIEAWARQTGRLK